MAFYIVKVIGFIELSNYEKPAEEVGNLSWSQTAQTYKKQLESVNFNFPIVLVLPNKIRIFSFLQAIIGCLPFNM